MAVGWATVVFAAACLCIAVGRREAITVHAAAAVTGLVGFTAWTALSLAWTSDRQTGALDVERDLLYVAALGAAVALGTAGLAVLRGALTTGLPVICVVSVVVHLLPDVFGVHEVTVGRLYYPLGYWNAQGLLAALALLLLADTAITSDDPPLRALAAAAVPWVVADGLLTLSRGAEAAVLVGLVVWLALDRERSRTLLPLAVLAVPVAAAAWATARSSALFGDRYGAGSAQQGHRLFLVLVVIAAASAAIATLLPRLADRFAPPRGLGVAVTIALAVALVVGGVAAVSREGGAVAPGNGRDPSRLMSTSLSFRNDLWSAAVNEGVSAPVNGTGAGSFGVYWYRHRTVGAATSSAHSLYLEAFGEAGLVGLVLLAAALAAPALAAVRSRVAPHVPALAGAYAAFLFACALDWNWLVPGVTVPALWCAAALVSVGAGGGRVAARIAVPAFVTIAVVCGVAAVGSLLGNLALARAIAAADSGRYAAAERDARDAARWQPWAFEPWMIVGQAEEAAGDRHAAIAAYSTASHRAGSRFEPWFALAAVTSGRARAEALARAARENPRARERAELCVGSHLPACPQQQAHPTGD
jgi:hypothetical protein